ncbi:DUF6414 family protein (plasmid) [Alkalihalophilus pseudofirmus]|uniref:DUF6414 family protein n=1 Tax=Alkalihalophilus pseudofirmus TaxID=79885 RepID=UPI00259B9119|nr:DUF6414 family protein [Alkalihalophilus pseudofirmus]WEG19277.1 DUF6414 family protein [Alkalihalophilus pseudofirmus]
MLKVVYFDEGSALDFISIKNGGNLIEETVKEKRTGGNFQGEAGAGVKAGQGIRRLLDTLLVDVDGKVGLDGSIFREKTNLVQSSISNTILTDFIQTVNRQRRKEKEIERLEGYEVKIVEDSIAYFQRISPYLLFTEGNVDLGDGINMNISKMQDALKIGKGYYELLAINNDGQEVITRFNNAVFRNNYSVSDLDQMNLVFYGIKVGKLKKDLLNFKKLMEIYSKANIDELEALKRKFQQKDKQKVDTSNNLDVYDIILAGVE